MASFSHSPPARHGPIEPLLLPLENGDRLDQKSFHARYEAMPKGFRAELVGGIVHVPSPLKRSHGRNHGTVIYWLKEYEFATPGVEAYDNATAIISDENEPQPDGSLLIVAPGHGQTREEDGYIVGAPELTAEIAASSASIDLHAKRREYEREGVKEYLVVQLQSFRVYWFVSRQGRFEDLPVGADGILRSEVFPGLWLDPAALERGDGPRLRAVLHQGLATPEHAAFVARLRGT
ncbi:MAG: Uma2 family endonuclease [Planctomycetia bacterium]|nr:Uma2 family endonuclease [Planctomycetia bacterium]